MARWELAYLGDRLVALRNGDDLRYMHQDSLGSSSVVTDASGDLVGSMKYFPFGDCRNSEGSLDTDKKFTGQRLDSTGLYYYGARYYDPTIGRFISADTVVSHTANPQSLNRYSYALNNPLRYMDPSGHDPNDLKEMAEAIAQLGPWGKVAALGLIMLAAFTAAQQQTVLTFPADNSLFGNLFNSLVTNFSLSLNNTVNTIGSAFNTAGKIAGGVVDYIFPTPAPPPKPGDPGYAEWYNRTFIGTNTPMQDMSVYERNVYFAASEEKAYETPEGYKPPPYTERGQSPGEGWTWEGSDTPESGKGNWVRGDERIYQDKPHGKYGPHNDWTDPTGKEWRANPDGSITPK